jgi:outer membrane lipoprotein-sorting protein
MKKKLLSVLLASTISFTTVQAITVDEIMDGYIENTGGAEAWNNLKGVKMIGEMNQGGMKFPLEIKSFRDGRQLMKFSFQGKELKQGVFDGETMWNTNFMTMKAEKADAEATANQKLEMNDFPSPLYNYKQNGYSLELVATEEKEGAEVYKLKLTKEPKMVDGKSVEDISFYFFDADSLVPISSEAEITSGPAKGKIAETKLSDYQEVDGLYFPFSMSQGLKDGPGGTIALSKIELNPTADASEFAMPVEEPEATTPEASKEVEATETKK